MLSLVPINSIDAGHVSENALYKVVSFAAALTGWGGGACVPTARASDQYKDGRDILVIIFPQKNNIFLVHYV